MPKVTRDLSRVIVRIPSPPTTREKPSRATTEGFYFHYADDPTTYWACGQKKPDGTPCTTTYTAQSCTTPYLRHLDKHPSSTALQKRAAAVDSPRRAPHSPPAAAPSRRSVDPPSHADAQGRLERALVGLALTATISFRAAASAEMHEVMAAAADAGPAMRFPKARALAAHAESMAVRELQDVAASFQNLPCALTFDGWTLGGTKYLSITCCAIDPGFVVRRAVLGFAHDLPDYTATSIAGAIRPILEKIGPVYAVTTDGARNMVAAAAELRVHHVPCMLHIAGLAMGELLEAMESAWVQVRRTLSWLHQSSKAPPPPPPRGPPSPTPLTGDAEARRHRQGNREAHQGARPALGRLQAPLRRPLP